MRRLIINADDFGLTPGVNRAIAEARQQNALTSATIMANAHAFSGAIDLARQLPQLRTGCHVVLIDGEPVDAGSLPSLTQGTGRFRSSIKSFALAATRRKVVEEEVQREAEAQIRKIQAQGIMLTHVDSHKHTHMFPQVLRPVLRAARACGIRAVRNPFEPLRTWPRGVVLSNPRLWVRSVAVLAFQLFASEFRKAVTETGMLTTDGTVGISATGKLNQEVLLAILAALPEGTWELVCHPGYADADLEAAGTRLVRSREVELEALTSEATKKMLAAQQIELISFADLQHS